MDALAKLDEEETEVESWDVRIERDWEAIEHAPVEGYRGSKEFMLRVCKASGLALEFAEEELFEDPDVVLVAVQNSFGDAFKWASKDLHRNRSFMLDCVAVSAEVLKKVSNKCRNDDDAKTKSYKGVFYCYRRGGKDGLPFKTGPCHPTDGAQCESCSRVLDDPDNCPLPQDREFITAALKRNWQALKHADKELQGEKDIVLAAVQAGGLALQYASDAMKADREVALAAVSQNWRVFKTLSKQLRSDAEIAIAACKQDWHVIKQVTKELRTHQELMDIAVRQGWEAFPLMVPEMRRKRSLAMEAVRQSWRAYEHTSADLRADQELALCAVRQHGDALALAAEELRADKEVALAAIRQDWRALRHAALSVRGDREVLLEAIQLSGYALQHAVEDMRSHPELVAAAMAQAFPALEVAVMPLFPDVDGLDPAFWNSCSDRSGITGKLRPAVAIVAK